MTLFLDLPNEIHELVVLEVLRGCKVPPEVPSVEGRENHEVFTYKTWRGRDSKIFHEPPDQRCPGALPLLLTNRRISATTREVLKRRKSKLSCVLDISILNDHHLFTTWLALPQTPNRVHELKVEMRLFGHIISAEESQLRGCGWNIGVHWSFYALLEQFIYLGPIGMMEVCGMDGLRRGVIIETLTLDFQSAEESLPFPPETVDYDQWRQRLTGMVREGSDELVQYRTRPEWLASYLSDKIRALLGMHYHYARFGAILYERIGTIRMIVNGQVEQFDLGAKLDGLQHTSPSQTSGHIHPSENRIPKFLEWKNRTTRRRERLGLPVVRQ